jgi:penicillin G amidase
MSMPKPRDTGMAMFFKWLVRFAIVLLLVAGLAAGVLYVAFNSTVPAKNGEAVLSGLAHEVQIIRDANAVPHIEASNYEDAVRALGFAHAQDRFWQMHVLRMVAMGRLSEMFGRATLDTDIFLRSVDLAGAAEKSFDALSPASKALLLAYAEGVNSWLTRDTSLFEAVLPPEFLILGVQSEPWQPWHSVALLKVMALTLDANLDEEITRLALVADGFSPAEIDELVPYSPRDDPPPLPDLRRIFTFQQAQKLPGVTEKSITQAKKKGLGWETGISASNNWVIAGSKTESGSVLLANDPHLGLSAPTLFYLAHLSFTHEGFKRDLIGATLPGTPFVLTGRNDRLAWGLTTTNLDAQDLFIERLKGDDPDAYATPDGWESFETRETLIGISGEAPVEMTLRHTRHGPVLPDSFMDLGQVLPAGHVGALQWVSLADDDTSVDGIIAVNLARSVDDFMLAAEKIIAPMQSIVVGDVEGNIGLIVPGRIPKRDPANWVAGRIPMPGWYTIFDWQGWLGKSDILRITNPENGVLATANANFLPDGYDTHITFDWDEPYRQERVEKLIAERKEKHSGRTMKQAQADIFSPALDAFRREAFAQLQAGAGQNREILSALRNWDGQMTMDSPLPLLMTAWWRQTQDRVFRDDLGTNYSRIAKGRMQPLLGALTRSNARNWCDDRRTPQIENCGVILSRSLAAATTELKEMYGDDWHQWRWGAAHRAFGEHRPFSSIDLLSVLFTVTPQTAGGSYTLMRGRVDLDSDEPYRNRHASVFRAWYDLADLDRSEFVISTGQSGHFLSQHYEDMADDWANSRYFMISSKSGAYRKNMMGEWMLRPK